MQEPSQAAALLRNLDRILILTHVRPDGDTVGCAAALCAGLRSMGKTAYLLPNPEVTDLTAPYLAPYAAPEGFVPAAVVAVDIAAPNLFPENAKSYAEQVDLAIDHHPSFAFFGRENLLRPDAAACGEVVYDILQSLCPITPEIALPLYVAIATDTGCFAYSNTTAATHTAAAALMKTGIDCRPVNKAFFQTKSRKRLALESAMIDRCQYFDGGRAAVLSVPLALTDKLQASASDTEDLAALGSAIEGVDCAVTMKERPSGGWKVSLRTGKRVNATDVCRLLGGGGHAAAAGCAVEGDFEEAKGRILRAIAQVVPDFDPTPSALLSPEREA